MQRAKGSVQTRRQLHCWKVNYGRRDFENLEVSLNDGTADVAARIKKSHQMPDLFNSKPRNYRQRKIDERNFDTLAGRIRNDAPLVEIEQVLRKLSPLKFKNMCRTYGAPMTFSLDAI